MIKRSRGHVFGAHNAPTMSERIAAQANPYRLLSNMPTQFGRTAKSKQGISNKRNVRKR